MRTLSRFWCWVLFGVSPRAALARLRAQARPSEERYTPREILDAVSEAEEAWSASSVRSLHTLILDALRAPQPGGPDEDE